MKVDKQKLIELLTERTGMKRDAVEVQLDELITRIRQAAEKGKALEIKGFGMFYFSGEGELKFDPADTFQTEINYKYAGMEPVEVRKSTETADRSAKEEERETGSDYEEERTPATASLPGEGEDPELQKRQVEGSSAPGRMKRKSKSIEKRVKNPVPALIYSIIAVLIVVIGAIIAIDLGFLEGMAAEEGPVRDELAESRPGAPPESVSGDSGSPVEESAGEQSGRNQAGQTEAPGTEVPADPEAGRPAGAAEREQHGPHGIEEVGNRESSRYGLHGSTRAIQSRYYSITLHSIRSESRAMEVRDRLQDEGYRAVVSRVDHAEMGEMWRIGIGQFPSVPEAQEAAGGLPATYRENHFIGLIQ